MEIQLSSGQGPQECELAVGKLLRELAKEYLSLKIVSCVRGKKADCYESVIVQCEEDLSHLEGTIKWICKSPYRPNHKRKNWFVDISILGAYKKTDFDETLIKFETFRSGGKGGQNVTKVETGVRVIHLPTGIAVVSTEARSQHMNKRIALDRLCKIIAEENKRGVNEIRCLNRLEHYRLERGNAVRTYEGEGFKRVEF